MLSTFSVNYFSFSWIYKQPNKWVTYLLPNITLAKSVWKSSGILKFNKSVTLNHTLNWTKGG